MFSTQLQLIAHQRVNPFIVLSTCVVCLDTGVVSSKEDLFCEGDELLKNLIEPLPIPVLDVVRQKVRRKLFCTSSNMGAERVQHQVTARRRKAQKLFKEDLVPHRVHLLVPIESS